MPDKMHSVQSDCPVQYNFILPIISSLLGSTSIFSPVNSSNFFRISSVVMLLVSVCSQISSSLFTQRFFTPYTFSTPYSSPNSFVKSSLYWLNGLKPINPITLSPITKYLYLLYCSITIPSFKSAFVNLSFIFPYLSFYLSVPFLFLLHIL